MNIVDRIGLYLSSKSSYKQRVTLSQNNIYVFPSRVGFGYLFLLLVMLLTAINYQNSLIYLFTFFLGALFFVSIWVCYLNVSGLSISSVQGAGCFVGEKLPFEVLLSKEGAPCYALNIGLGEFSQHISVVSENSSEKHTLLGAPRGRGVFNVDRMYLSSYYPFGLIRAWTWQKLESSVYVYPKPINSLDLKSGSLSDADSGQKTESEELSELKGYEPGENASRIVWKRYATRGELVVRYRDSASLSSDWVRWNDYDTSNKELRLSLMCFDVLQLAATRQDFGFELPGLTLQPGSGERHKIKCLEALARF